MNSYSSRSPQRLKQVQLKMEPNECKVLLSFCTNNCHAIPTTLMKRHYQKKKKCKHRLLEQQQCYRCPSHSCDCLSPRPNFLDHHNHHCDWKNISSSMCSKLTNNETCRPMIIKSSSMVNQWFAWWISIIIQILFIGLWSQSTEAIQSITEVSTVSGSSVDIPCNTTWVEDEVSLVLWFRGDTGVPIYRVDARNVPLAKAIHTTLNHESKKRLYFDMKTMPPVLRINPVMASDAAEYRCRVDFRQSRTQNVIVLLNVTVPPKELLIMDVEGQKLEGVIGPYDEDSNVILICEAEGGKPSPSVNWYQASRLIDSTYTIGPHGLVRNELNIRNLNRSDFMSILTCRASNNNVTEPISATVILDMNLRPIDVKILPKSYLKSTKSFGSVTSMMIDPRLSFILPAGSKAEFQCQSTGSRPAAQISWWLGTERLSSNVRDSVNEDGNATVSTIMFVPNIEDNGKMLTCRADNLPMPHTALKDERLLNVQFAPQLRISFGTNIQMDSIREGSDVYLECRVKANPAVKEVVWLHEGRPMHSLMAGDNIVDSGGSSDDDYSSNPIGSTVIMTNQSLVIQKVHRSHRGRYQCVAFNEQGETVSDPLYLKVNFGPSCKPGQKLQYGVSRNEQIRIRCEVEAEPSTDLTFRWTLNTSGSETSVEWASFTVNATTSIATYRPESSLDYGTLACLAQNSIGIQNKPCIYSVVPAGRPDAVRGCAITNHSMSTLLVECVPGDDGGLRQHFNLEVYVAAPNSNTNGIMSSSSSSSSTTSNGHQMIEYVSSTSSTTTTTSLPPLQRLHSNHSSSQPNFIVSSLTPGTPYTLVLYATNAKGRSHSVSLSAVTLSAPEKHTARGSFEQIVVHPILAILIGIVTTIVIAVIILILLIRSRMRPYGSAGTSHHYRRQASQGQSSVACTGRSLNDHNGIDPSTTTSTATDALIHSANGDLKLKPIKNNDSYKSKNSKDNKDKDNHLPSLSKKKISPKKQQLINNNKHSDKNLIEETPLKKGATKQQQLANKVDTTKKKVNRSKDNGDDNDVDMMIMNDVDPEKVCLVTCPASGLIMRSSPSHQENGHLAICSVEEPLLLSSSCQTSTTTTTTMTTTATSSDMNMSNIDDMDNILIQSTTMVNNNNQDVNCDMNHQSSSSDQQQQQQVNHNCMGIVHHSHHLAHHHSNLTTATAHSLHHPSSSSSSSTTTTSPPGHNGHQNRCQTNPTTANAVAMSTYDAVRCKPAGVVTNVRSGLAGGPHHQLLDLSSTASSTGLSSSSTSSSPNLVGGKHAGCSGGSFGYQPCQTSPNHHHHHSYVDQYSQYHPYMNTTQYVSPHHYDPTNISLYTNNIYGQTTSPTPYQSDQIITPMYENPGDDANNLSPYTQTLFVNSLEPTNAQFMDASVGSEMTTIDHHHSGHQSILYYNPSNEITVDSTTTTPTKKQSKRCNVTLMHQDLTMPPGSVTIDGVYVSLAKMSKVTGASPMANNENNSVCFCNNNKNLSSLAVANNKNQCPNCCRNSQTPTIAPLLQQPTGADDEKQTLMMMMMANTNGTNENNSCCKNLMIKQNLQPTNSNSSNCDQTNNQHQPGQQQMYLRHSIAANSPGNIVSGSTTQTTANTTITSSSSTTTTTGSSSSSSTSSHEICLVNRQQRNGTAV